ncbi:MOSC domain-containing protein [Marinobacter sp. R17]|uniref:MOSC domain-containing protein n=1 Tax=Marinobacter sp. R17 TaxID=2484250 RepID=UPI000F4CB0EF|nr:MOSC domain-containing protein [Marinobacter sp. R17]ROU01400.1 MOSC domain-containing protein [Marinobacter sp. R17]
MAAQRLQDLMNTLPQQGTLEWIGLRPGRDEPMLAPESATIERGQGLIGDRFRGRPESKRQVTLIQAEHLPVIASLVHQDAITPDRLRRNLVVRGLNLLALKGKRFRVGEAVLEMTGLCDPCSKMEAELGPGGYNAMRGHGGITTRVIEGGEIRLGDGVEVQASDRAPVQTSFDDLTTG